MWRRVRLVVAARVVAVAVELMREEEEEEAAAEAFRSRKMRGGHHIRCPRRCLEPSLTKQWYQHRTVQTAAAAAAVNPL